MSLVPVPLTYQHIRDLAPRVRAADIADLTVHGNDPEQALVSGMTAGEAYAIMDTGNPKPAWLPDSAWDEGRVIGAGGWTVTGGAWTLWADLTRQQSRALLKIAPAWARIMAIRAKRPLGNYFLTGNTVTERWLRATGCVTILDGHEMLWQDRSYTPFFVKPLEALPYV